MGKEVSILADALQQKESFWGTDNFILGWHIQESEFPMGTYVAEFVYIVDLV